MKADSVSGSPTQSHPLTTTPLKRDMITLEKKKNLSYFLPPPYPWPFISLSLPSPSPHFHSSRSNTPVCSLHYQRSNYSGCMTLRWHKHSGLHKAELWGWHPVWIRHCVLKNWQQAWNQWHHSNLSCTKLMKTFFSTYMSRQNSQSVNLLWLHAFSGQLKAC